MQKPFANRLGFETTKSKQLSKKFFPKKTVTCLNLKLKLNYNHSDSKTWGAVGAPRPTSLPPVYVVEDQLRHANSR